MSDTPLRCLQCGKMILRETYRLCFCSEKCHQCFTYDGGHYMEDKDSYANVDMTPDASGKTTEDANDR